MGLGHVGNNFSLKVIFVTQILTQTPTDSRKLTKHKKIIHPLRSMPLCEDILLSLSHRDDQQESVSNSVCSKNFNSAPVSNYYEAKSNLA